MTLSKEYNKNKMVFKRKGETSYPNKLNLNNKIHRAKLITEIVQLLKNILL